MIRAGLVARARLRPPVVVHVRVAPIMGGGASAAELLIAAVAEVTGTRLPDIVVAKRCKHCGGAHGRPFVHIGSRPGPHVSIAHTAAVAAVAVSMRAPVGVDIEGVGAEHGGAGEPPDVDLAGWVRAEAVLKATGDGLVVDPSLVDVGWRHGALRVSGWRGPGRRPPIRVEDLALPHGLVGAVAVRGRRPLRVDLVCAELMAPSATAAPTVRPVTR